MYSGFREQDLSFNLHSKTLFHLSLNDSAIANLFSHNLMFNRESENISRLPGYIGTEEKKLFSWIHYCADVSNTEVGVVICPPLGIDYMNSHRALRHLADEYARAGIPAFRFDYSGCGDSSDQNPDLDQLEIQIESISTAMQAFKAETGLQRIGIVGFKFGATLAALLSARVRIDFLALWAPIIKGKRYLREIRLLQQMSNSSDTQDHIEAGGLVINSATSQAWQDVDLCSLQPKCHRVLIIPADEIKNEQKLCDSWQGDHRHVSQLNLEGSSDMLVDAHFTRIPLPTIKAIVDWSHSSDLAHRKFQGINDRAHSACVSTYLESSQSNIRQRLKESCFACLETNKFFVLTEPEKVNSKLPLIIFLNSGANHHVGPNRFYVTLCRQLAVRGFCCIRADLPGLGDGYLNNANEENVTYLPDLSRHIDNLLGLVDECCPHENIVLAGLCSGAYGAYVSAIELDSQKLLECILINPLTFYWEDGMTLENAVSRSYQNWGWYLQSLKEPARWLKFFRGRVNYGNLLSSIVNRVEIRFVAFFRKCTQRVSRKSQPGTVSRNLAADLGKIENRGIDVSIVLADSDPGWDILMTNAGSKVKKMISGNALSVYMIEEADHTFSMKRSRCKVISVVTEHLHNRYVAQL